MTDNTAQLRLKLDQLYNESIQMSRLRTGSPITHMIDGTLEAIADHISQLELPKKKTNKANDFEILKPMTPSEDGFNQALTDTTAILAKAVEELIG